MAAWLAATPPTFRFSVKAQRGGSWRAMREDPEPGMPWLTTPYRAFGERLGTVLFRVPDTTKRDDERLAALLAAWPSDLPLTLELQDPSWHVDEVTAAIAAAARAQLGAERAARVVDLGDFGLAELRSLVERSRLFVGGDTGPLHIAATTRTPIVGIYGPTLPARSAPWRARTLATEAVEVNGLPCRPCDQRVCEPGDFRCLTLIGPEDVASAAERVLRHAP